MTDAPTMVFIALPAADLARSRAFYRALGYAFDARFDGPESLMVVVSETIRLMLQPRESLARHSPVPLAPEGTASALVTFSAAGREAVDAWVAAAVAHGGTDLSDVEDHGYMYGRAVADPDGNGFQVMWMDVEAAMRAWAAQAA